MAVAVESDVLAANGVKLPLLVAEAVPTGIWRPLQGVERTAGWTVELIVPDGRGRSL
jgi:hypothetical protein